jgi:hypothetical protein
MINMSKQKMWGGMFKPETASTPASEPKMNASSARGHR